MSGAYAYTAEIWPPLIAAILLAVLGLYSWQRCRMPAALALALGAWFGGLWLLGVALELLAVAPDAKITWHKFQAAWQMPTATAMACFALEYSFPGRWLSRRVAPLVALPSLLTILMILTGMEGGLWRQLEVAPDGSIVRQFATPGAILLVFGIGLVLVNIAAFLWLFVRSPRHRWPAALMLSGDIAARSLYGLYQLNAGLLPSLALHDAFITALLLDWTMYALALFGFRIFDPLPAAQATALAQMREGMVVLDSAWRVASLNRAAVRILGVSAGHARGRTLAEFLPAFGDLSSQLAEAGPEASVAEISLGPEPNTRLYALDLSTLNDFRGPTIGHLLLLRDVTEQRQAQAQILEQQRMLATLQEREQLAQELHDGLSQNLAFLNLQAQAVQVCLQTGQQGAAQANLAHLVETSRDLQSDMRDLIDNLLTVSLPTEGFCATLRQIVARFGAHDGLTVELDIDGPTEARCGPNMLPPDAAVQLIRIVQEALANVRKHAGKPDRVRVRLEATDGLLQLAVTDNGDGFDPATCNANSRHFGLQVMRQRAAHIGGRLIVQSEPGQGTRVEVRVPLGQPALGTGARPAQAHERHTAF